METTEDVADELFLNRSGVIGSFWCSGRLLVRFTHPQLLI